MQARNQPMEDFVVTRLKPWLFTLTWATFLVMAVVVGAGVARQPDAIEGVSVLSRQARGHDDDLSIAVLDLPPAGGQHSSGLQECGVYPNPVAPDKAVHSLEHGAVWITHQTDLGPAEVDYLQEVALRNPYLLMSPFPGQRSPVVLTAWGVQLELQDARDERVQQFIARYLLGPLTPERGAPCKDSTLAGDD